MSLIGKIFEKIAISNEKKIRTGSMAKDDFGVVLDQYYDKHPTSTIDEKILWNAFFDCDVDYDVESIERFVKRRRKRRK